MNIQRGYTVGCLAMAPHLRLLAFAGRVSGGNFETVQIWNLVTGQFDKLLPYPGGLAERLAWSADGSSLVALVSKGSEHSVVVYSPTDGTMSQLDLKSRMPGAIALSRHGTVAASAAGHFDPETGQETILKVQPINLSASQSSLGEIFELKALHPPEQFPLTPVEKELLERTSRKEPLRVDRAALSPDGARAATALSSQGAVLVWNLKSRRLEKTLMGMEPYIQSLAFSPDGRRLAVAARVSGQKTMPDSLYIWDVETGHLGARMQSHAVKAIALSPDGRHLATATGDARIMLFDAGMQAVQLEAPGQTLGGWPMSMLSKSGRYLAAAGEGGLSIFSAADARLQKTFPDAGDVITLAISPNDKTVVCADKSGRLMALSVIGQKLREFNINASRLDDPRFFNVFPKIKTLAFAPDSQRVLVATTHDVLLWNVATGQETRRFLDCPAECEAVAVSPDGRFIATGGEHREEHKADVRIWKLESGEFVRQLPVEGDTVTSLAFSQDGHLLATGEQGRVSIWNTDTGEIAQELSLRTQSDLPSQANVGHLAFLKNDGLLALTNDNGIQIWDLKQYAELIRYGFKTGDGILASFSIDAQGGRMAASQRGGKTSIWDLQSGIGHTLSRSENP